MNSYLGQLPPAAQLLVRVDEDGVAWLRFFARPGVSATVTAPPGRRMGHADVLSGK